MSEEFNWHKVDPDEVVAKPVQATRVYVNGEGDIVIHQQSIIFDEEDSFIFLPVGAAERLIAKMSVLIDQLRANGATEK